MKCYVVLDLEPSEPPWGVYQSLEALMDHFVEVVRDCGIEDVVTLVQDAWKTPNDDHVFINPDRWYILVNGYTRWRIELTEYH